MISLDLLQMGPLKHPALHNNLYNSLFCQVKKVVNILYYIILLCTKYTATISWILIFVEADETFLCRCLILGLHRYIFNFRN